jgi:hypothetical protein
MNLRLTDEQAVGLLAFIDGLKSNGKHIPDVIYAIEKKVHDERARLQTNTHKGLVHAAAMQYATVDSDGHEIVVDDDAAVSEAPGHAFVQAWVMVKFQEAKPVEA